MEATKEYVFYGDGRKYSSTEKSLSCVEIKRICGFTSTYQMYAQRGCDFGDAGAKNIYLYDAESADLTGEYVYFYAIPPATF